MANRKSEFFPSLLASCVEQCGGMDFFDGPTKLTANDQKYALNFVHNTSDHQLNVLKLLAQASEPVKDPICRLIRIKVDRCGSDMKAGGLAS